jgi:CheY-like chemotaxis protein
LQPSKENDFRMFILLVNNNQFHAAVMKEMLLKAGFDTVGFAENGYECLQQVNQNESPDVVIIDESLCVANGLDIVNNIRILRPEIRIIILTEEESKLKIFLNPEKRPVLYFPKDSLTAKNLPQILYSIFTEKLNTVYISPVRKGFSSSRRYFAGASNA